MCGTQGEHTSFASFGRPLGVDLDLQQLSSFAALAVAQTKRYRRYWWLTKRASKA
jgi:hypothetical protein